MLGLSHKNWILCRRTSLSGIQILVWKAGYFSMLKKKKTNGDTLAGKNKKMEIKTTWNRKRIFVIGWLRI